MNTKLIKNTWKIGLSYLIILLLNIILLLLFEPRLLISGFAILSIFISYIITILFKKQFDFPLFFVRDEASYWGGLFSGLTGGLIGYLFVIGYDMKLVEFVPFITFIFFITLSLTTSFTATLINDIKNTDYVDTE